MYSDKTCCFTGHREISDNISELKARLIDVLKQQIENGIVYFGAGGARGFDALAAQTVIELKRIYPHIKLILVLPCRDQTAVWSKTDVAIHEGIKQGCDKITVLSPHYYKGCMHVRNRHLVNHSSVCICYKRKNTGGTYYTVNYAKQKGLKIIEL